MSGIINATGLGRKTKGQNKMKSKTFSKKCLTPPCFGQSASRGFPLALTLVAGLLSAFCSAQVHAALVFNTLGPNNTYNQTSGLDVQGSSVGLMEAAAEFAPLISVNGAWTIELGLTKNPGGPVDVFLYGNAAGVPDNTDQTFLGSVTPTESFGTTDDSLVSLTVSGVPLTQNLNLWIVLKPGAADTQAVWNDSATSNFSSSGFSTDDVNWTIKTIGSFTQAFRITTEITTVPDSGTTLLLILGSVAALLVLQRVLRNERSS